MEAGERAAGDGDEDERNHRAADDGAAALGEFGERGHVEVGHDEHDAEGQRADGADLQEGGQVVARQEQHPHGQDRRGEAVHRDQDGHGLLVDVEPAEGFRMGGDVRSGQDAQGKQDHADDGGAEHIALAPDLHVQAHDDGDRDGRGHGVGGPQAVVHGVDHGDGQARQRQQEDGKHGPRRYGAGRLVDFLRGDVGEALPPVPHRGEQHDHIVHAACEHAADENPEQAGHVAELGGQHGAEQGAGGGDGGEMVPEEHVLVGIHVIVAVGVLDGRRHTGVIQVQHLVCNEQAVKTIPYRKDTQGCENHRKSVHTKPLLVKVAHTAIGRPPRSYPLTPLPCAVRHRSGAVLIYEFKGNGIPCCIRRDASRGPLARVIWIGVAFCCGKSSSIAVHRCPHPETCLQDQTVTEGA